MIKQSITVLLFLGLTACATKPMDSSAGFLSDVSINNNSPLSENVSVEEIRGGKEKQAFGALYAFQVTDESLNSSLKESLEQNGMLSKGSGDYLISAEIIKIKTPAIGVNFKVESEVRYRVTDVSKDELLMDDIVIQEHTTKFGEALLGEKRLFLATQGSVKANITEFIRRLAATFDLNDNKEDDGKLIISFNTTVVDRAYLP